jgi:hypothetical protein
LEVFTDIGDDHLVLLGQGAALEPIQHIQTMLCRPHLYLEWEPIQGATRYHIYRHTDPQFIPSPNESLAITTALSFMDSQATGNPTGSYYYLICAANDLTVSSPSIRVGKFDRDLVSGVLSTGPGGPHR